MLAVVTGTFCLGQGLSISGTVRNVKGESVETVQVILAGPAGEKVTTTDAAGHYEFAGVAPGGYSLLYIPNPALGQHNMFFRNITIEPPRDNGVKNEQVDIVVPDLWATLYKSTSPEGLGEVTVDEGGCFADCSVRISHTRGARTEIFARGNDCAIQFAHAAWSGSVVAVFIAGGTCRDIRVAYDTMSQKAVEFDPYAQVLADDISRAYTVTSEEIAEYGGVFGWATYPGDGRSRRSAREFRTRYRR